MRKSVSRRQFMAVSTLAAGALGAPRFLRGESRSLSANPKLQANLIQPVNFSQVTITDPFWRTKLEKVATATLQACIIQTEQKTPRIRNFEKVARKQGEKHEGIYYDDSDVYKALEAIAYSLKNRPDSALEQKADEWIDKIAAAQLPDGYLNTFYTLNGLDKRWTDMEKHEDYCAGHLIEAGIAYYQTTGKRKLLDVGIRFADHLDNTFRVPNRPWVTGHQEIELALMKLYHLTHEERYLKLADWYLDQRGRGYGKGRADIWGENGKPEYVQDLTPVKQQTEITGHAVRAMYLYSGAADVAAVTGDQGYMQAMKTVWEDVVYRNMYVTGGIGSSGDNEGFSHDYDLPNEQAYCETCASVGMVFWNRRMGMLTGEGQYIDVMERSLFNGALAGLSLSGDRFFYSNPLASTGAPTHHGRPGRKAWFGTACCPSNIARLVASIGSYVYGVSDRGLWVNLFIAGSTQVKVGLSETNVQVESDYPWSGNVKLTLNPVRRARYAVHLRIPGWATNIAVPGDLYRFAKADYGEVKLLVNRKPVPYRVEKGYAVLDRAWNKGDVIELTLPMPVRQVVARPEVIANLNRVAIQRGPLVYCVEGADNSDGVFNFIAPRDTAFLTEAARVQDEPIVAIRAKVAGIEPTRDGLGLQLQSRSVTAIPYYTWANRENYEMQVWLPTKIEAVKINT